jgi:hypothetical protein
MRILDDSHHPACARAARPAPGAQAQTGHSPRPRHCLPLPPRAARAPARGEPEPTTAHTPRRRTPHAPPAAPAALSTVPSCRSPPRQYQHERSLPRPRRINHCDKRLKLQLTLEQRLHSQAIDTAAYCPRFGDARWRRRSRRMAPLRGHGRRGATAGDSSRAHGRSPQLSRATLGNSAADPLAVRAKQVTRARPAGNASRKRADRADIGRSGPAIRARRRCVARSPPIESCPLLQSLSVRAYRLLPARVLHRRLVRQSRARCRSRQLPHDCRCRRRCRWTLCSCP